MVAVVAMRKSHGTAPYPISTGPRVASAGADEVATFCPTTTPRSCAGLGDALRLKTGVVSVMK